MSEKRQGTACHMREQMLRRYDDGLHHKHDKNHIPYRQHAKTHPIQELNDDKKDTINCSSGQIRIIKLRKLRKRLDKGRFH